MFADSTEPKEEPWLHPMPKTPELLDYLAKMQAAGEQKAAVEEQLAVLRRTKIDQAERAKERKELQKQLFQASKAMIDLEFSPAAPPKADVLVDVADPKDYPVLLRGEAQNKGPVVTRHFLSILSPDPKHPIPFRNGSGRMDLARAIASPSNPITARVLVNRVWQQHFGTGFVATPDDLGNQSAPPTDPELLDYLATRFMADGWSIKKLQRLIMLSSAYQEASTDNPQYAETDPDLSLIHIFYPRAPEPVGRPQPPGDVRLGAAQVVPRVGRLVIGLLVHEDGAQPVRRERAVLVLRQRLDLDPEPVSYTHLGPSFRAGSSSWRPRHIPSCSRFPR